MLKNYCPPLFLLLFIVPFSGFAQFTVEGKVIDAQQNPVPYANVVLLNAQDSITVYKGAVSSENGDFQFENIEGNEYLLNVSFVGFKNSLRHIEISENTQLAPVVLTEDSAALDEVSINYKNPSVTREVDRLVFRVENTSLSSGSSWDILKKTPGVIVANNMLQVRNQSVQVYINDRKVQLSASELQTLLENYSAENIRAVEVITTPPARYDAEGGAVLNIITSKGISLGYKGSVDVAYTQAVFPKYNFGTSHYYKNNKLNLFANYSFSPRKEFKEDDSYINFINDNGNTFSRWDTDFDRTTRSNAHNANLILDYNLDEKNVLNFSSSLLFSPNKTFENDVFTQVQRENVATRNINTESSLNEDLANAALDLEYKHLFDQPGAEFSARAHYTRYEQDRQQEVFTVESYLETMLSTTNQFSTDAQQEINILTGQVDYRTPIGNTSFETGLKASVIESESGIDYYDFDEVLQENEFNMALSDNFLYDENIYAAYFSLARDWEKWSLKGGLRGEFTERTGTSESMEQVDSREYFELFPTVYLQHTISENHSLTFDYSRRIERPRYESLNPFRYFLNEYDFSSGNPNLRAAISNSYKLNYTFKNAYFFDLYYNDRGDSPEAIGFQDNEDLHTRRVYMNLLGSLGYGLDITHGRSITNSWYAYGYVSLFHEERTFLAVESGDVAVTNKTDAVYAMLSNSFTLSKDGTFSGDLTLIYISDWVTGSYNMDPMTTLSIGLRKTLWNNRAEVTLKLEDILDQTNTWLRSRYLNQDNGYYPQPETRYVRLGFKYNFGNFRLRDNQRAIEAVERERL